MRLTPRAVADLEQIWSYTAATWSLDQAERYHNAIVAALDALVSGCRRGRATAVRAGYLKYAVGSHLVFYRVAGHGIDVIRILHQSMDVDRHL